MKKHFYKVIFTNKNDIVTEKKDNEHCRWVGFKYVDGDTDVECRAGFQKKQSFTNPNFSIETMTHDHSGKKTKNNLTYIGLTPEMAKEIIKVLKAGIKEHSEK